MIDRLLRRASSVLLVLGGIAATLMMLQIGADIVGKYVFDKPVPATLEIVAWYYMVATIFVPIAYVQLHGKHLTVELFTQGLSQRRLATIEAITAVLTFLYAGTLFVLTFRTAVEETGRGEAQDATFFDLPVWPSRWILPLSLGVMMLIVIRQFVQHVRLLRSSRAS
jgi:TRAP-type C4-dicarboxylate transport system permease small subunit